MKIAANNRGQGRLKQIAETIKALAPRFIEHGSTFVGEGHGAPYYFSWNVFLNGMAGVRRFQVTEYAPGIVRFTMGAFGRDYPAKVWPYNRWYAGTPDMREVTVTFSEVDEEFLGYLMGYVEALYLQYEFYDWPQFATRLAQPDRGANLWSEAANQLMAKHRAQAAR